MVEFRNEQSPDCGKCNGNGICSACGGTGKGTETVGKLSTEKNKPPFEVDPNLNGDFAGGPSEGQLEFPDPKDVEEIQNAYHGRAQAESEAY